jgi:hypothetical protein
MKYSVGNTVMVRKDLDNVSREHFSLWTDMLKYAGQPVEIEGVRETEYGTRYDVVGSIRSWSEDCFEGLIVLRNRVFVVCKPIDEYSLKEVVGELFRRVETEECR